MARASRTGGKKAKAKARKTSPAKGRKAARAKRGVASRRRKGRSVEAELALKTSELREAVAQQAATAEVLQVIGNSSGDLARVFDTMLDKAMQLCDAEFGVLGNYDGKLFRTAAARGLPAKYATHRARSSGDYGPGTAPYRHLQGEPLVHIVDLKDSDAYRAGEPNRCALVDLGGARCLLCVPLLSDGRVIGCIMIFRKQARPFSDRHIALLKYFAAQAVIAIENARLFNETKQALERQNATANILRVISNSIADAKPVFDEILSSVEHLFGSDDRMILLADQDGLVRIGAIHGRHAEAALALFPVPLKGLAAEIAFSERRLIAYTDVLNDADVPEGLRAFARRYGQTYSIAIAPLLTEDRAIGVLNVTREPVRAFTEQECELLQTLADQAVIAIENARLFNETREALEHQTATAEVLKIISTSSAELTPVFEAILANAVRLCDAKFGMLFLYEEDEFRAVGKWHLPAAYSASLSENPIRANPMIPMGRVLMTKQPVHVADVLTDQSYIEGYPGMIDVAHLGGARTLVQVPLLKENELVGTIAIYRQEVRPFDDKQVELVRNFARQAVIAIENARLLGELRQRTADLSKSLDDLRTAQDRLVQTEKLASLGQLTAGIAHEIKNPLNFVNNFSSLSAELVDELDETLALAPLDQKMRGEVGELTQMLKSNLEKVVQHGKRADSIVKNMLQHSREGSGEYRSADINALVEESLNLAYHGARAEKSGFAITLRPDLALDAGVAQLYPQEITRALLNLIANGFYAAIRRKTESGDESFEPVLSASTRNLGNTVEIRIRDNGAGIPPEVREKMFNPFFTTKPTGEGTGLGLSMTHDIIVKQHGGRIDVETEPGVFTEFIISLPRDSGSADELKSG